MYRRLRNPQIASVIVCSKWDRMVYNTVLTAEKQGPQIARARIAGAQIAGVYCTWKKCQIVTSINKGVLHGQKSLGWPPIISMQYYTPTIDGATSPGSFDNFNTTLHL